VTSDLGTCILKFHGRFYVCISQTVVYRIVEFIDILSGILGYISVMALPGYISVMALPGYVSVMAHLIFIAFKNEFLLKSL
jgi:hypothetical protein